MSTSITFPGARLFLVSDSTVEVVLNSDEGLAVSVTAVDQTSGGFQVTASGAVRLIREPGKAESVEVSVDHLPRTTRETLEAMEGETLCYRDYKGRLLIGTFLGLSIPEQPGPDRCKADFTFVGMTYSIEV